jgi:arginine exporter protein ArgO
MNNGVIMLSFYAFSGKTIQENFEDNHLVFIPSLLFVGILFYLFYGIHLTNKVVSMSKNNTTNLKWRTKKKRTKTPTTFCHGI